MNYLKLFLESILEESIGIPDIRKNEPALMTVDEYIEFRNKEGTKHPETAYNWNLEKMNSVIDYFDSYSSHDYIVRTKNKKDFIIFSRDDKEKIIGIIYEKVLYHKKDQPIKKVTIKNNKDEIELDWNKEEIIKYFDELKDKIVNVKEYNEKKNDKVLNRVKLSGESFVLRMDKYGSLSLLNDKGFVVGVAQNEWGATLVSVASEYRGKGVGDYLLKEWYKLHPDMSSGGYTRSGEKMDRRYWEDRVREFLSNGWYSELIKKGKLKKERFEEITKNIGKRKVKKELVVDEKESKIFVFVEDTQFVIYDSRFYEDQNEDYIYGFGFIRHSQDKYFFYKLDYERKYAELTTRVGMQLAYDNGYKIYIGRFYGDSVEEKYVPEAIVEKDYIYLKKPIMDIKKLSKEEKEYRKKHDKFNEMYNSLLETANGKW